MKKGGGSGGGEGGLELLFKVEHGGISISGVGGGGNSGEVGEEGFG